MPAPDADGPLFRVLVADSISPDGVELLRATPGFEVTVRTGMTPDELREVLPEHDALVVRSATKVTAAALERPGRLRAIGRAGTGVDNIDVPAATRAGVVVMNTPGGNSIAAAELTLAHLLALARHLPAAHAALREGRWDRKSYMGSELAGRSLGIVGLGRIGREVARRARSFRMEILGYDPFVTRDVAEREGIELLSFEDLTARADVVTLHLPLGEDTRHCVDAATLGRMKQGAWLINCARGGLVDEGALHDALESGHLGGAALDVFEVEPPADRRLIEHPRVVATPHLGASTREAQLRVGTEIAEKIRDFLQGGVILDAVNFPSIGREDSAVLGPVMRLAEQLGSFAAQVVEGGFRRIDVRTLGTFAEHPLKPIAMAAVKGMLAPVLEGAVSYVNALDAAAQRGITVNESRSRDASPYAGLLRLGLETDRGRVAVAGTIFAPDRPRLVEVDGFPIETRPSGQMLFLRNLDVPGVLGKIGTILGEAGVNIAGLHLGRPDEGDRAVSIVDVDGAVPPAALDRLRRVGEILSIRSVSV